jgi:hypothetical protein
MVVHLLCKCKVLSSNPSPAKEKEEERKKSIKKRAGGEAQGVRP